MKNKDDINRIVAMRTVIISVEYGGSNSSVLSSLLASFEKRFNCIIERVRTDSHQGKYIKNINEAFEFSGYQEGLVRVLSSLKADISADKQIRIIFINDTILSGHLCLCSYKIIKRLIGVNTLGKPSLIGIKMQADSGIDEVTKSAGYISTFAFALALPLETLKQIRFYDKEFNRQHFHEQIQPSLPLSYRKAVDSWLSPNKFFKGWYKSIPGQPLSFEVLRRKQLTIYLEHRLSAHASEIGVQVLDIRELLSPRLKLEMQILRFFDRIKVNLLKLRIRLPLLLHLKE